MDKSTVTPPSLEEKKALPNCGNKEIHLLKIVCCTSFEVYEMTVPMYKSLVFGDDFFAQGLHLKSHQKCSDQSSSSTLTESSFLFDPCLIHRDTVMLE